MGEVQKGRLDAGLSFNYQALDTNYNRSVEVLNRNEERTTVSSFSLQAEMGLTRRLGLSLGCGYSTIDHELAALGARDRITGLTDATAGLFFDIWGDSDRSGVDPPHILTPYVGVRIPIGTYGGNNIHGGHYGGSNSGSGEDLRLSNGTYAPIVGLSQVNLIAGRVTHAYHVYYSREMYDNPNGYRPGDSVGAAFNLSVLFPSERYEVEPMMSVDYGWIGQSTRQGVDIINSGGHNVSVTPQLMLTWKPEGGMQKVGKYSLAVQVPTTVYVYKYGADYYAYEGQLAGRWGLAVAFNGSFDFY